jgi:hypothetical protein
MARVMIFTLYNTDAWWRYLGSSLRFATHTTYISDRPDGDINVTPAFYRHIARPDIADVARRALAEDGCNDVITRCRLLRTLDRGLALKMIGAMWAAFEEIFDREKPDLFLSWVVDRYLLDIVERMLKRRGVPYLGIALSPFRDRVMLMAKGEYVPVYEPSEAEVDTALAEIVAPQWVPSYLPHGVRYDLPRFLKLYAKFNARWLAFEFLRRWERNPLDYRYLVTWTDDAGFRIRLRDWSITKYMDAQWRAKLNAAPADRRIFLGLQVNPEAAIEYWVAHTGFIAYEDVFVRAATALGESGYSVFVKDHPGQFGFRQVELIERLSRCRNVSIVPYDVPGQFLVQSCHATFTYTGTVGFQAAMAGRYAIVSENAYYAYDESPFLLLREPADVERLPERLAAVRMPDVEAARRKLARHVLRASAPGRHTWRGFSPADPKAVEATQSLVESLNAYLPPLLRARRATGPEGTTTLPAMHSRSGAK